jgi:hypothetical protein
MGGGMKGIIFTEFIEMLESRYSPEFADQVLELSDLPSGGAFTSVGAYDPQEMMTLVGTTADLLGTNHQDVLREYGHMLFGRLAVRYPEFVVGHDTAFSFLERLGWLHHSEVTKLYPDAQVLSFDTERMTDGRLLLTYQSRLRLGDLAEGLVHGVVAHFREPLVVHREDVVPDGSVVRFVLTRMA